MDLKVSGGVSRSEGSIVELCYDLEDRVRKLYPVTEAPAASSSVRISRVLTSQDVIGEVSSSS